MTPGGCAGLKWFLDATGVRNTQLLHFSSDEGLQRLHTFTDGGRALPNRFSSKTSTSCELYSTTSSEAASSVVFIVPSKGCPRLPLFTLLFPQMNIKQTL